jgi:DNA-binding IscR family transcriptional regulator
MSGRPSIPFPEPAERRAAISRSVQAETGLDEAMLDLTALGVTRTVRGAGGGVMLAMSSDKVMIGTLVRQREADQAVV